MTDRKIEQVARAMEVRRAELIAKPLSRIWPELSRAAIEAMREPTRGMVEDGYAALMDWDARTGEDKGISDTWVAMINAALNEEVSE